MIRRSLRLDAIYAWVDGNVVADIGCDHGYIPLWCVQDKGIKAYACDVASKPLERARALFKQEEADIPCLLMDGIEGLPGDVDQIVIAGMGGQLIEHILERSKARAMRLDSMILSPHKDVHLLRSYLRKAGWRIEKERFVQEGNHFYPILYVRKGNEPGDEASDYYGYHVVEDATYEAYLVAEQKKWRMLEQRVPADAFEEGRKRLAALEKRMKPRNE
ncbi:class I SAM-dependent methyltransferase [uncultured Dubosiella sp.]|uniref:tRNA (adenine(22)-N(1))-methyltransferase n=4 Tax=uncultured Dubosiella sp. TaxID=1937011 RepID=UPI00272DE69C|nr:class I SAM-dependent methyltransferase [uncultured Dubosiella sp.]